MEIFVFGISVVVAVSLASAAITWGVVLAVDALERLGDK